MIGDPASAPPRTDLPFLRHRVRPRTAATAPAAPAAASPATPPATPPGGHIDYTHREQRGPAQPSAQPPAPSAQPSRPPASAGSLDLSDAPAAAAPPRGLPRPAPPPQPDLRGARVTGRAHHLLTRSSPTAVLSRVQSGVGHLTIDALLPPTDGGFRLAALYQLRSGGSSVVALSLGRRFAPPSSRRPVLVAGHDERDEQIAVDLRQIRDVERLAVVGFSESRSPLTWNGTLVVTTFAGARIELPLESLYAGSTAVLLSLYNVDGRVVVRAEMETVTGDLRQAARVYGYDRITWRDDRTPVD